MKPILAATDFTPASRNAVDYAAQLAKDCQTSLVIFHTWLPAAVAGAETSTPFEDISALNQEALDEEAKHVSKKWKIAAKGIQHLDFVHAGLRDEFEADHFSIAVMGLRKYNAAGRLLGSVATSDLHHEPYPLLLIPDEVAYRKPHMILVGTDLENRPAKESLKILTTLNKYLGLELHLSNIKNEDELWSVRETNTGIWLDKKLQHIKHSWEFPEGKNVNEKILEEAKTDKADWVAVLPDRMPWYEALFHRSHSRRLAFSVDRPMLVLPAL